jgi:cobalamin biosynthesis protein CobW
MLELVKRRDDIDHILIETSGLALPKPLVQAFNWPEIKKYFTVDAVITVIDGPAVAAGRFAHDTEQVQAQRLADESLNHDPDLAELLDDQLSAADLVIVSKSDILSDQERSQVEQVIATKVPTSVKTAYIGQKEDGTSDASIELVMGLEAAAEDRIEAVHTHHDHHHDHGGHHEHAHDHFDSCVIHLGEVDGEQLQVALAELLSNQQIYRAKGFAALPNKPMRQVIQAVGQRLESHFDRLWTTDEARRTSLVMIGKHLHVDELTSALKVAEV